MEDLGWEGGVRIHLEQRQEPWKVAFTRSSKGKSPSDESVAKKGSKERKEDEEGEGGSKGQRGERRSKCENEHLAALDLLWCENQQEGNVDQDVGDCDDGETQDDRP